MYGVENTYDVKSRLKKLQNLELVSRTFDRENTQEYEKNHMKRYMLNPFRAFNFTQPERYNITINQVIELVEKLETICDQLVLEETERINVNDYFKRWQNIVETLTDDTSSVWHNVFKERFPEEWYFENEELISMVYLIANTKLNEIKNINLNYSWVESKFI